MQNDAKRKPRVLVVGGGFAGVKVVHGLRKCDADVILLDRHNYHLFQPLLYQVAMAGLSPADIAYPIRRIFRNQANAQVVLADMHEVDLASSTIIGRGGKVQYDYLVIACGSTHSYFGRPEWAKDAPGLKTLDDATEIRKRMLIAFEEAEYEADDAARRAKLTFAIVGGGPTGVELAGSLREIAANDISKDFRAIDTKTTRIILFQGGERLLPGMQPKLGEHAKRDLEKMGVEVRLNSRVTGIDDHGLFVGEERVECENIFWASGVEANGITRTLAAPLDKAGRVKVAPDLSIPGYPNAFVVGDAAAVIDPKSGLPVPGLAPAAMQMGRFVARIISDSISGKTAPRPAFHYVDKGTLATIGKAKAVGDIKGLRVYGLFAWLMWTVIHIFFLVTFRSRFLVTIGWATQYIFRSRAVRLITGETKLDVKRVRMPDMLHPKDDFATGEVRSEIPSSVMAR